MTNAATACPIGTVSTSASSAWVDDLELVIDRFDYEKVAILGPSQAASVSIAYAQRHPDRVSHLILYGGYARGRGRRGSPEAAAESEALVTLIRQGWGAENPAFRQTMTTLFMPDASPEEGRLVQRLSEDLRAGRDISPGFARCSTKWTSPAYSTKFASRPS